MESQEPPQQPQAQPNQQQQAQEDSSTGSSSKSSFLCKQSSTRWTPTTDQIRILKDLYYNNGVRSPSAEQIQRISARLRQYGKIEGKNVFYWFQNHKARERQKKRFTVDLAMQRGGVGGGGWKPADQDPNSIQPNNKYTNNITPGVISPSSPTSPSVIGVGPVGSNIGYGSVLMEKSFRECIISQGGSTSMAVGGSVSNNFGWVGMDPYPTPYQPYPLFDRTKPSIQFFKEQSSEMETLPLFPMHGEDTSGFCSRAPKPPHGGYNNNTNWYRPVDNEKTGSRTSLELTLNYTPNSPDPE